MLSGKPRFVTAEEHQAQWDAGWPDFHPEDYCQRCFGRNIKSWYVDGPLWMQAMIRGTEIVCPQCFTELHAEAIGDWQTWELRPAQKSVDGLRTAILNILIGNPHASQGYLAHRIAIEVADRARQATDAFR